MILTSHAHTDHTTTTHQKARFTDLDRTSLNEER